MRRLISTVLATLVLTAAALVQSPPRVSAGVVWCWADPIVQIGGATVSINIGVAGTPDTVERATVTIFVPEDVRTATLFVQQDVFEERVVFVHTETEVRRGQPIPVKVVVSFKARANVPTAMAVSYHPGAAIGTFYGTTSSGMSTQFAVQ